LPVKYRGGELERGCFLLNNNMLLWELGILALFPETRYSCVLHFLSMYTSISIKKEKPSTFKVLVFPLGEAGNGMTLFTKVKSIGKKEIYELLES